MNLNSCVRAAGGGSNPAMGLIPKCGYAAGETNDNAVADNACDAAFSGFAGDLTCGL